MIELVYHLSVNKRTNTYLTMANKTNDNSSIFQDEMNALGVKKSNETNKAYPKHKATKKSTIGSDSRPGQTSARLTSTSKPVVEYKDLEPESHNAISTNDTGLSAQLLAQSVRYHRGGLNNNELKRLTKGQFSIGQRLDLHGFTQDQALDALNNFINNGCTSNKQCLLIIHGKGYHSGSNKPKIKSLCERFLRAHPLTIAFCSAQAKDGGTGAVYVLIKKV